MPPFKNKGSKTMQIIKDRKEVRKMLGYLQKVLPTANHKLVKVGSAKWANVFTNKFETVSNIWFLGWKSSARPYILTGFNIYNKRTGENIKYHITDMFTHVNISKDVGSRLVTLEGDDKKLPKHCDITIYGQEFCNPITALHVFEGDDNDIANLLRVTLMSQNFDDAFGNCYSVTNGSLDKTVICPRSYKTMLKNNSTPVELILGLSSNAIRNHDSFEINDLLRKVTDIGKDEVWVKPKSEGSYSKIKKRSWRQSQDRYSKYYPVYDYYAIQKMEIKVPKNYFDLGVYGLGSAGTAILDQVCRSNWIDTIYMCDFDSVEPKNMINQWYTSYDCGMTKIGSCENIIRNMQRSMPSGGISTKFTMRTDTRKFQETPLETNKFKYVVSGFDSITARQEFLDAIMDGKIEAKYLIDCRYLDLACSIYFIDLENMDELNFYKANLDADAELIKARILKEKLTREEFIEWIDRKGFFQSNCRYFRTHCLNCDDYDCKIKHSELLGDCRGESCIDYLYDLYLKSLPNKTISRHGASCVKYNYIDIYKYVGAIVFGAMRKIENNEKKPFTAIEAETDVKGLPNYMVVKE